MVEEDMVICCLIVKFVKLMTVLVIYSDVYLFFNSYHFLVQYNKVPNNVRPKGEIVRKYNVYGILNCCLIIKLLKLMTKLVVYSCVSFFLSLVDIFPLSTMG